MVKLEYKYSDITEKIIGCCMKVHNTLGNGFQEVIYQRAIAIELDKINLPFEREVGMTIFYDDRNIGTRRVDFLIDDKISVEIKAVAALDNIHLAQALNYIEAFKIEIGMLINFGNTRLEFKRLIKTQRPGSS